MESKNSSQITDTSSEAVPANAEFLNIQNLIYTFRGQHVIIDSDIAALYQVETGALNRAVKRNPNRFPEDFCFQLSPDEHENLKCQIGISSLDNGYGGRRSRPYAFTEQGISMLSKCSSQRYCRKCQY